MDIDEKKIKDTNIKENIKQKNEKKIDNNFDVKNTNQLSELKDKLLKNQRKIHDIKLRHLAYIENLKKNAEIEIKNIQNIKQEEFLKKIIPIIDLLENILCLSKKYILDEEPLVQGIKLTLKSFLKIISSFGVKIEGKKNEIFNPKNHNIILTENSKEIQPNHIISVTRKGFIFNNIILRKADVIVSKV